ncbi:mannosyltransferase [Frigoribacterium sp. PhB107]|uniref:glycosyltransferase family 39 protein n=1 Tax=Frigoribacterium sp. PhB107 TaxID=2485172 RepID=UPI000FA0563B|nr:glycosyltransferase family 39 protein [Frigoribacterium sp. PhB107]ROP75819.1 mannosyltransferase [Frigoribacterium sp. PhB107]
MADLRITAADDTTPPTVTRGAEPEQPPTRSSPARLLGRRHTDAVLIGVLATLVSGAFLWVPSVWYDEAATVVSATRTWGQLWAMIHTVDLVHAAYYAFMHLWFDVFPYSPTSLRVPSALATGVAAGLTVSLTRILVNRRTAVVAGLLFVLLPRVTWMGGEGRSYALSALFAVALTLVLVVAARRTAEDGHARTRRSITLWWVGYALLAVVACAFFLYIALLVVGHALTMLVRVLRDRRDHAAERSAVDEWARTGAVAVVPASGATSVRSSRRALLGWFAGAGVAGLASLPLAWFIASQNSQVSWIERPSFSTLRGVLVTQWFQGNENFAVFALVCAGATLVVLSLRLVPAARGFAEVVLPWMVVPTVGLVGVSLVVDPLYSPRYLTFGTPAIAMTMAVAIAAIPWRRVIALVLLVAVVLTSPTYVEQRQPEAKDSSAWDQVADLVAGERAAEAPGTREGVVFGPVRRHPKATSRIIQDTYPEAFRGMSDFTLETPGYETDGLWETQYPLGDVLDRTDDLDVVWLITSDKQDWRPRVTEQLGSVGFTLDEEWGLTRTNVLKFTR